MVCRAVRHAKEVPQRLDSAEDGLLDENFAELNEHFYAAQPWQYFHRRLAHLMLVAGEPGRLRTILADGVSLGPVTLTEDYGDDEPVPTADQSFVAVEAEVLLHHAAETLLRFIHAHADEDPCPWLRMTRLTRIGEFKEWVRSTVAQAPEVALDDLCLRTLACDPGQAAEVRAGAEYLRLLGRHFLDADSYNAAKHGMAVRGAAEQWSVSVADREMLNRAGATVSWLARWPRDQSARLPRWTEVTRVLSVEAAIALVHVTTHLMHAAWLKGRERHLGEPLGEVFRPAPPDELLGAFDLRHPVIADILRPLRYDGHEQTIVIQSRHLRVRSDEGDVGDAAR